MVLIPYTQFYRKYGVRRLSGLTKPLLSGMETMRLPRGSILHYLPQDSGDDGISYDDIILTGVERIPMVEHITELATREGNPRNTQVLPGKMIRDYHRKYRRMRPVRKLDSVLRDDRTLIIENYAILQHTNRYTRSFFSNYYKWKNIQSTMWTSAVRLAELSDRQQYVRCFLPRQLPSLIALKKAEASVNRNSISAFSNSNSLMLLDVWTWLGNNRKNTPMGIVTEEAARKINLIWVEGNRWFVINLGMLNDWISDDLESVDLGLESSGESVSSYNIQKRFLRSLMTLFETRTVIQDNAVGESDSLDELESPVDTIDPAYDPDVSDSELGGDEPLEVELPGDELPTDEPFDLDEVELEEDLRQLELIGAKAEVQDVYEHTEKDLEEHIQERCNALADMGLLSGAEYRRLSRLAGKYKTIKNPYGGEATLDEFSRVTEETLKMGHTTPMAVSETNELVDPSFYSSSLMDFTSEYVEKVLPKDIVGAVLAVQKAGVIVSDYKVEEITDAMSSYEAHTVRLTPTVGSPTTIRFRVPKIDSSGRFKSNGITYKIRNQRADLPIRKTSPTRVALTSYHSKLFVDRSVRSTSNYGRWLTNFIMLSGKSQNDGRITDLRVGTSLSHLDEVPFIYSTLGNRFRAFTSGEYQLNFDYRSINDTFGEELVTTLNSRGLLACGFHKDRVLVVDKEDTFYSVARDNLDDITVTGKIQDIIPLPMDRAPIEFVEAKIFNRTIPVGLILGYWLGFEGMLRFMGVTPRRVLQGERAVIASDEYGLKFNDETLVFSREDRQTMLVVGGFSLYHKVIKDYSVYDFDRPEIYFNVMEAMGVGAHYVRELDTLLNMFVDPITKDLLTEMGEPIDLPGLLKRAAELLMTDYHPREVDMEYMRIRGYERIAGAVYSEMVRSLRGYKSRPNSPNSKVEMNPYAVWMNIMKDPSLAIVEDINPVQNLKEQEVVTFTGHGGRSTRSMMKRSRVYGESDMGVISEGTVDSSNVGVIAYTTADPNFTSLRGTTRRYDKGEDGPARLLSTTALLSPCSTMDDPRRTNFAQIQAAHVVATQGYQVLPLTTGYDTVLAHRVDDLFAFTAKQDGKVIEVSDKHITVEYKDGTTKSVELGRRYGTAAGATYPHTVITDLKEGARVKSGDVVSYNQEFFTKDTMNPKQVVWKSAVLAKTAILDSSDTLEDSSAISTSLAERLATQSVKVRDIVLTFDQSVRNLVNSGDKVDVEDILCTIEDSVTADLDLFDEDTIDTLKMLGAQTPRVGMTGVIEDIEVYYNGDKEDMSDSLRAIANASDRRLTRVSKALRKGVVTGRVDSSFRVGGNPLVIDSLVIRVHINGLVAMGVGDKGVFGNQLKTIVGRVMSGINETEDGEPIDAIFGLSSLANRIVNSPFIMGGTNTLALVISKRAADLYFEED